MILTGDHGEVFRDRDAPSGENVKHPNYLCEELTHTPFVVAGGPILEITSDTLTSGLDMAPTVAELFGQDPAAEWDGVAIGSDTYNNREYIISALAHTYGGGAGSRVNRDATHVAVRTDEVAALWWFADDRSTEFYCRTSEGERRVEPDDNDHFQRALDVARKHGQSLSKATEKG